MCIQGMPCSELVHKMDTHIYQMETYHECFIDLLASRTQEMKNKWPTNLKNRYSFQPINWIISSGVKINFKNVFEVSPPRDDVDVSSSILMRFSIINHPFWGYPYFWKQPCKPGGTLKKKSPRSSFLGG